VAAGSPGPLERKTPCGLCAKTSSADAVAGNTITSHPAEVKQRRILRFAPKSMATTFLALSLLFEYPLGQDHLSSFQA
jgi:hypothetical protein